MERLDEAIIKAIIIKKQMEDKIRNINSSITKLTHEKEKIEGLIGKIVENLENIDRWSISAQQKKKEILEKFNYE